MRLSQNPTTGIVEAYTDEGVFIGPIYSQGDFVGYDDKEERLGSKSSKKKDEKKEK